MRRRVSKPAVLLLVALFGCDEPGRCAELRQKLLTLVKTECPKGSSCKGNPNLDRPTVPFSQHHYDILYEMEGLGCDETDLGPAPWFCNNGEPRCPDGYSCCLEGLSDVCRRGCASPDGGG